MLLLFIVVPAVELALLIEVGSRIGTLPTFALIVLTGIVGSTLARWQGLDVLRRAQQAMQKGELPASALGDGLLILLASALLITPGVLTDRVGFLLLVPPFRTLLKAWVWNRLRRSVQTGNLRVQVGGVDWQTGGSPFRHPRAEREVDDYIDVEARTTNEEPRG